MEEIGRVIQTEEDRIVILLDSSTSCENCKSCSSYSNDNKVKVITLSNTIKAKTDDLVILALSAHKSIFIYLLLYVFPVIMMVTGYFVIDYFEVGYRTEKGDNPLAIFFSFLFLVISFVLIYYLDKHIGRKNALSPKLIGFYQSE